ncbi:sulfonate transport system permease protein [Lachnospiraceae bacterium]|nr:sulfonate transport system permease protein [Lachnospiraceae bacterium]
MEKKGKKYTGLRILSWVILVALFVLWEYASAEHMINPTIMSKPTKIFGKFLLMLSDRTIFFHLMASLGRVFKGVLIGAGLGLILGLFIGLSEKMAVVFDLFIGILRPIPPIAWIPLLILALGIGEGSKVTVIAIGSFWPMLLDTINGVKSTDNELLELGRTLEKNRFTVIFKIILPSAVPGIFTGLRQSISRAWSCVVTAEMIAASMGVGYLIQYARELSQPALMFVGVVVIGMVGLLIDLVTNILEKKIVYWNE